MTTPTQFASLQDAVEFMLARIDGPLKVGAPLGLGKPHRLLNALYARVAADPSRPLQLYTALSLNPPEARGDDLEARFIGPFVSRQFGDDFVRLDYVQAMLADALPTHIEVEEFYFQSGALMNSTQAQRRYASLNYTMVASALADRGMNALVQRVAREPGGTRLSLSCNTDLTFDAVDAVKAAGLPRPLLIAEIDPELPWLGGSAAVDEDFFDAVVTPPGPYPKLFGLPRQPVSDSDYAIGFYASALVRDGGTLQIGIGALADALCHALALRQTDNAAYRRVLAALDPQLETHPAVRSSGGLEPFSEGLYGCSEMFNEGFSKLIAAGVIKRTVVEDQAVMQRLVDGSADDDDRATLERDGQFMHAAFYLGSPDFYDWLRELPDDIRRRMDMRRVGSINELYGGNETLERLQRRHARFFNTCMMATALGAAVSDALEDGRVVSGVGGQYNFVAMGHALPGGRSALLLRSVRDHAGKTSSNIRWNYGHTTIPRHLRDVYISEYGIADVLGKPDEDCVIAMTAITDTRFQQGLLDSARGAGKLRSDFAAPAAWSRNTPEGLREALTPLRRDGFLPDYPLGSDFTAAEQRLVKALGWLKTNTGSRGGKLRTIARALFAGQSGDREAMQRMRLDSPGSIGERLYARLLTLALRATA